MSEQEITPLLPTLLKAAEALGWERYEYKQHHERDDRSWSVKAWRVKDTGEWIIDESDMSETLVEELIGIADRLRGGFLK